MAISKIKLPGGGSGIDVNDARIHIYRTVTGTAAVHTSPLYCTRWNVSDTSIASYTDGMVVCIKVPVLGDSTCGTALQINSLGYKPVISGANTVVSSEYAVGSIIWAVYNSSLTGLLYLNADTASAVTGCWQIMDEVPVSQEGLDGIEAKFLSRRSACIHRDGTGVIKELRGNSLAWNQLGNNGDFSQGTTGWQPVRFSLSASNNVLTCTCTQSSSPGNALVYVSPVQIVGHKYLYKCEYYMPSTNTTLNKINIGIRGHLTEFEQIDKWSVASGIETSTTANNLFAASNGSSAAADDMVMLRGVFVIDLTLMFGEGKEPSTVAEFEALYPEPYYPQNNGAIINNAADTLVTDGFNQWDEEISTRAISSATGEQTGDEGVCISSLNYIPVFPNTNYYVKCLYGTGSGSGLYIKQFDGNKTPLSGNWDFPNVKNSVIVISASARYIKFMTLSGYGTTYHNDICINLSWSGYRDGEYEPYWKRETGVDMRKIYGKLNGAGEMVQVFPDGGRSAGTIFDSADLVRKEADVRCGGVDMGTLDWGYTSGYFYTNVLTKARGVGNIISSRYANTTAYLSELPEKSIRGHASTNAIYVMDSAYTDAATFKAAMNGVMLNFELETPLHYTDLMYSEDGGETFIDIPSVYKVADFGTERIQPLVDAQGNPVTAPFRAVIQYNDAQEYQRANIQKNYDTLTQKFIALEARIAALEGNS